jgi:hypothetical protein
MTCHEITNKDLNQTLMKLEEFERVLIDGGENELIEFGRCKYCVVVDWRDDAEQILDTVKKQLPEGYLQFRQIDKETFEIESHGITHRLKAPENADVEGILQEVNRALLPNHEMRIFQPTIGDGYSLLLRPAIWWSDFAATHPARLRKLFVTIDERLRQTGNKTHQKSWWKRLTGKSL